MGLLTRAMAVRASPVLGLLIQEMQTFRFGGGTQPGIAAGQKDWHHRFIQCSSVLETFVLTDSSSLSPPETTNYFSNFKLLTYSGWRADENKWIKMKSALRVTSPSFNASCVARRYQTRGQILNCGEAELEVHKYSFCTLRKHVQTEKSRYSFKR